MQDNISPFNSEEYDNQIKKTIPYYNEFYKQIIEVIKINNQCPLTWLDIGCGTGKMAEAAFNNLNIDKFIFCDCSEKMINIAKERFNSYNCNYIISNAQELDFYKQFDIITSIQVNHYLQYEQRILALQKSYQALKDNGLFFTFENFAPFSNEGKELYLSKWKNFQLAQGKTTYDCDTHISRYGKDYFPITVTEHLSIMKNCGFKAVEILWLSNMQVGLLGIK